MHDHIYLCFTAIHLKIAHQVEKGLCNKKKIGTLDLRQNDK